MPSMTSLHDRAAFDRSRRVSSSCFTSRLVWCVALVLVSCGGGGSGGGVGGSGGPQPIDIEVANADRCEILDPDHCMLPFPSDALTVADASLATGRRIRFEAESLPANKDGVHIDPTEWNRSDGFSPGAQITVVVPNLDATRS